MSVDINEVIRSTAMLASFHTRCWTARKMDRKAAAASAEAAGAAKGAYTSYRNLMYGADARLKRVRNLQQTARMVHHRMTLPWGAEEGRGIRMLPTVSWMDYAKEMGELKKEFRASVEDFVHNYSHDVAIAMGKLNITDQSLYPPADRIGDLFLMRPEFQPIPAGTEFRGLPQGVQEKLSSNFEAQVSEKMQGATQAAMRRAMDTLRQTADRMDSAKNLQKRTYGHVQELPGMLRAFNLLNDSKIASVVSDIETTLDRAPFQSIKSKEKVRTSFVEECREIADGIEQELSPDEFDTE